MLDNTHHIINIKNLVNQTTDEHHKLAKEFEDEKERTKKSNSLPNQTQSSSTKSNSTNSTRSTPPTT